MYRTTFLLLLLLLPLLCRLVNCERSREQNVGSFDRWQEGDAGKDDRTEGKREKKTVSKRNVYSESL